MTTATMPLNGPMIDSKSIEETFQHVPGIGPKTEARLKRQGLGDWQAVLQHPGALPVGEKTALALRQALTRAQEAYSRQDIAYFINCFPIKEQWRILATFFDEISYFDIETSGLSYDAYVTCVVCYHRGKLYRFVHGENLDDFLDLLEDVKLLVSFNGSSFDIPQLLRTWHIPDFPCPHIDLRWQCYHHQLDGGLKHIEPSLGIQRPPDLLDIDGAEAVWLWYRWNQKEDLEARTQLLRYCAADVLTLYMVTVALLERRNLAMPALSHAALWSLL